MHIHDSRFHSCDEHHFYSTDTASATIELILDEHGQESRPKRQRTSAEETRLWTTQSEKSRKRKPLAPQFRQVASIPDPAQAITQQDHGLLSETVPSPAMKRDASIQVSLSMPPSSSEYQAHANSMGKVCWLL